MSATMESSKKVRLRSKKSLGKIQQLWKTQDESVQQAVVDHVGTVLEKANIPHGQKQAFLQHLSGENDHFWNSSKEAQSKNTCFKFIIDEFNFVLAALQAEKSRKENRNALKKLKKSKTQTIADDIKIANFEAASKKPDAPTPDLQILVSCFSKVQLTSQQSTSSLDGPVGVPSGFRTTTELSDPGQSSSPQHTTPRLTNAPPLRLDGAQSHAPVSNDDGIVLNSENYSIPTARFSEWSEFEVHEWLKHHHQLQPTTLQKFNGINGRDLLACKVDDLVAYTLLNPLKCASLRNQMRKLNYGTDSTPSRVTSREISRPKFALPPPPAPTLSTMTDGNDSTCVPLGSVRLEQIIVHVAKPLLLRLFHIWWDKEAQIAGTYQHRFCCSSCIMSRDFSKIKRCCLAEMIGFPSDPSAAVVAVRLRKTMARLTDFSSGEDVFDCFDVGKLNVLCHVCSDGLHANFDAAFDMHSISAVIVTKGRNVEAHERLSEEDASQYIKNVIRKCKDMMVKLVQHAQSSNNFFAQILHSGQKGVKDMETTIQECKEAYTDLNIQKMLKEYVLSYARAGKVEFGLRVFGNSTCQVGNQCLRARWLSKQLQTEAPKVLVIPPMSATTQTDLALRFKALMHVKWTYVIDLSGETEFWSSYLGRTVGECVHLYNSEAQDMTNELNYYTTNICTYVLAAPKFTPPPASVILTVFANWAAQPWRKVTLIAHDLRLMNSDNFDDVFRTFALLEYQSSSPPPHDTIANDESAILAIVCDVELLDVLLRHGEVVYLPGCEPALVRPVARAAIVDVSKLMHDAEILDVDCDFLADSDVDQTESDRERQLAHDFFDFKIAHWVLFRTGVVVKRRDVDRIKTCLVKDSCSVSLLHGSLTGGTTTARYVLYELRFQFVCIIFTNWQNFSITDVGGCRAAISTLHEKTGLIVLVLLDLQEHLVGNARGIGVSLASMPCCRVLECVHKKGDDKHPQTAGWKNVVSDNLTTNEFERITKSMTDLNRSRTLHPYNNVPLNSYVDADGTLDTDLIKKEAVLNKTHKKPNNWQQTIIEDSHKYPKKLLDIGLLLMEVFELSRHVSNLTELLELGNVKPQGIRIPLIHCGFMALCRIKQTSSEPQRHAAKLIKRVGNLITAVLEESDAQDVEILKLVVFGSLFAPGVPIDTTTFGSNIQLSARVTTLVRQISMGGTRVFIMIDVPTLAEMLASDPTLFGSETNRHQQPQSSNDINKLLTFLKEKLPTYLRRGTLQMRQLVHIAFCDFKIWHFDDFGEQKYQVMKFSFLIELLMQNRKSHEAVDLFHSVAAYFQKADKGHKGDKAEKRNNSVNVAMITHACRLRGNVAQDRLGHCHFNRLNEYHQALDLIENCDVALRNYNEMKFREGMLYRYLLLSFVSKSSEDNEIRSSCTCSGDENSITQAQEIHRVRNWVFRKDTDALFQIFTWSKTLLDEVITQSRHTWAHPLVAVVQLILDLCMYLKGQGGTWGDVCAHVNTSTFEGQIHLSSIRVGMCVHLLCQVYLATKYIRQLSVFEPDEIWIDRVVGELKKTYSLKSIPDALRVLGRKWRGTKQSTADLETVLCSLADDVVATNKSHDESSGLVEGLMVVSTRYAALPETTTVFRPCFHVKFPRTAMLQNRDQALRSLVVHWRTEVTAGRAHGLGPAMNCVMLTLYTCIFMGQPNHGLLHEDNNALKIAEDYNYSAKPRFFVRNQPALKDQPLTAFISVDDCKWEIYRNNCKQESDSTLTEAADLECFENLADDGVTVMWFEGTIADNKTVILWHPNKRFQKAFPISFDHHNNVSVNAGDKVQFVLGLRMKGLKAFGVSLNNCQ